MLPEALKCPIQDPIRKGKRIHAKNLQVVGAGCSLPLEIDRKYQNAPADWRWQWVFRQERRLKNAATGEEGRRHLVDESIYKFYGRL